jgi:hypothetical protein
MQWSAPPHRHIFSVLRQDFLTTEFEHEAGAASSCYPQSMQFLARLRDRIRDGEIDTTIRVWRSARVRVGGRYPLAPGHVVVDSIMEIDLRDISGEMARRSGFDGVVDLLKTAQHGAGRNVYLIAFHYEEG